MAYTTADCITLSQQYPSLRVVNSPAPLFVTATDKLVLDSTADQSMDHHEVSFYVLENTQPGNAVMGFNRYDGMVVNNRLELAKDVVLRGSTSGLTIDHLGADSALSIGITANHLLKLVYNVGGGTGRVVLIANAQSGLTVDSSANSTFDGNAVIESQDCIADFTTLGFCIPVRTSNPTGAGAGELYYNSTDNKIYAYIDGSWVKTGVFA